jgi:hypothetical protein
MTLLRMPSWSIALLGAVVLTPCGDIVAQQGAVQGPRVAAVSAFDDPAPELAESVADAAQQRVPRAVSRERLWLVSKKDIDNAYTAPWPTAMRLEEYRDLARLLAEPLLRPRLH